MDPNKIKFHVKEYFSFSRGERIGVIVLVSLIVTVLVLSGLLPRLIPASPAIDVRKFEKEIAQFEKATDSLKVNSKKVSKVKDSSGYTNNTPYFGKPKVTRMELNAADSGALDKLPGIGPAFAKRIIRYRTILGGYYSVNQLNEVYGIKPETFEKIKKFLYVDTSLIRKIDLNIADFKEINAHPYISFEQTKSIMKYRNRHRIISLQQLEEAFAFTADELMKLRPYLELKQ